MQPIGIIYTQYHRLDNMPIQSRHETASPGRIVLNRAYQAGLTDLEGFSHLYLIYLFHLSRDYELMVRPFLDEVTHGVFATRAPRRPNPIGLSIVRLESLHENIVEFTGADMIDGTPLLDIKPYVESFDLIAEAKSGWVTTSLDRIRQTRSDRRFIEPED
jgi:tRNA-Thr(GGU) m(6)t(6)A37 methyltransferase TsaA